MYPSSPSKDDHVVEGYNPPLDAVYVLCMCLNMILSDGVSGQMLQRDLHVT